MCIRDRVDRVLYDLKNNPYSRRIMTNIYVHEDLHAVSYTHLVINGIRGSIKAGKIQKESNAESEAQASETETSRTVESKMASTSSLNKKMSIADRANLVSQLGDATEDEE